VCDACVTRRSLLRGVGAGAATSLLAGASSTAAGADDGSWTIVGLSDTQYYARDWLHEYALAQTEWIAENADAENIVFVTHGGDIVHEGSDTDEWERMDEAMSTLDGAVRYSVLPGNHDYPVWWDRSSGLDNYREYFGASRFDDYDWFGGTGPDDASTYQLFSAGDYDFLHLALEWEPRDETLEWAQDVLDEHPDRPTVLTTHAYLTDGDKIDGTYDEIKPGRTRFVQEENGNGNPGEEVWQRLVSPNPQVFMVLNGHFFDEDGEYRQVSKNSSGQRVFEMLANYQRRDQKGESQLRLISFEPGGGDPDRISVSTYNPYNDEYEKDDNSEFEFDLDFDERFDQESSTDAPEEVSFQQGTDDYEGTIDTGLREADPETEYGDASPVTVDTKDPQSTDNRSQALVRFDDVIGDGDGQVPSNATVNAATLTVETEDEGDGGAVHRLLRDWDESDTWASLDGGVNADGDDATTDPETKTGVVEAGSTEIDVTASVQAWVDGEPNHGWAILPLGDDGWDFSTVEGETPPRLTVTFEVGDDTADGGDDEDDGDSGSDDGDDGSDGTDDGGDDTDDDPSETVAGDVDGDGDVDDEDVDLVQRHLTNDDVDIDREAADMNGDGEIDITDVVEIVDEKGSE
jgi:hypothetical protein